MTPKVLYLRSDIKLAGPARLMLSSALALRDRGVDTIFASSGGEMLDAINSAGFKHFEIPDLKVGGRTIIGNLRAIRQIRKIAKDNSVTVMHSFNAHAGLMAYVAGLFLKCKIYNTVLGNGKEIFLKFFPFKLIAVSNDVKKNLISHGVNASNIVVIHNSTLSSQFLLNDINEYNSLWDRRERSNQFTLVSVAVFTGMKGHRETIDALFEYRTKYPESPIYLNLVGNGPSFEEIKEYVTLMKLSTFVRFTGSTDKVVKHLDNANVFVHFPKMETFGIVLAEANARGLPVIANDVGGIPEVIGNGNTGLLVEVNNIKQIVSAIHKIRTSSKIRKEMGWNGAKRAALLFGRETLGDNLLNLYYQDSRHQIPKCNSRS